MESTASGGVLGNCAPSPGMMQQGAVAQQPSAIVTWCDPGSAQHFGSGKAFAGSRKVMPARNAMTTLPNMLHP